MLKSVLKSFILVKIIVVNFSLLMCVINAQQAAFDSDSVDYNYETYKKLAKEYDYEKERTTILIKIKNENNEKNDENQNSDAIVENVENVEVEVKVEVEETDEETITRLSCDEPYFWNSFQCLWLDIKHWRWSKRTRYNTIIVAVLLSPFLILFIGLFGGSCYFWLKYRHYKKLRDKMSKRYEPGVIYLPDGKIDHFPPTREEEKALEKLLTVLASVN